MVKKFPELRTSNFYASVDQTVEKAAATILAIPQAFSVKNEPVDEPIDLTATPPLQGIKSGIFNYTYYYYFFPSFSVTHKA